MTIANFPTALVLAAGLAAAEAPRVIVLGGQSNMAGLGASAELDPAQKEMPSGITFVDAGKPAQFATGAKFGPEIGVAHALAKARPGERFILVKWAVGGTSMAAWAPAYDPERAKLLPVDGKVGHLFPKLVGSVQDVLKDQAAVPPHVIGFLWMQGEADCRQEALASAYFDNFSSLIAAFRKECSAPAAPFVFGHVNPPGNAQEDGSGNARYPFRNAVRAAQERAAKEVPGAVLVETDDLQKNADKLHYSARGQLELGRRLAEALLKSGPAK